MIARRRYDARLWLRGVLAGLAVVTTLFLVGYTLYTKITAVDATVMIGELPLNEQTKAAIDIVLDRSKEAAQLDAIVLAGLWGLMIAKKGEARITLADWPESLMYGSASILLVYSLALRSFYVDNVTEGYLLAAKTCPTCIPDIFAPSIKYYFDYQIVCLSGGITLGVVTLFSAHRLREQTT